MNLPARPVLYGIPNCDTVRKARGWLAERGIAYEFHDYKRQGVPQPVLAGWVAALGWEPLLNRRGPTWRKLDAARQAAVHDGASALALMVEQPSVIRRPVLVRGADRCVGFDADDWLRLLG